MEQNQHIKKWIEEWMADSANNSLEPGSSLPAFDLPVIGFASGDDPLFTFLKNDIGPEFYWTPEEAMTHGHVEIHPSAEKLSVVAWILPQTETTRLAHRKEKELPSIAWSRARHYGEKVNEKLRRDLVRYLEEKGTPAIAPVLIDDWQRALSPSYGFASSWSERHTAHVCGLGTFGLSDGLITKVGKAVRVGSVIFAGKCAPTPRSYDHHNQWCLFHEKGKCLACVHRCPAGALSEQGHDKEKCKRYIREVTAVHVQTNQLGFKVNSCGLCQTKVPCEARNPTSQKKNRSGAVRGKNRPDNKS